MEPAIGIEPMTFSLPRKCSTSWATRALGSFKSLNENKADFKVIGGGDRIWTYVGVNRQIYSLLPLATRAPLR